MALRLRIESTQNDLAPWEVNCTADVASIGRDSKCTVMLPDPNKHLSRQHVTIERVGQGYTLIVNSKVNPVSIGGRDLAYGEKFSLSTGDTFVIANFRITAHIEFGAAPPPRSDDPFAWLDELKPASRGPSPGDGTDPFADLSPSKPPPRPATPDPFSQFGAPAAKADHNLVSGIGTGAPGAFGSPVKSLDPLDILGGGSSSLGASHVPTPGLGLGGASSSPLDQWLGNSGSGGASALVELNKPRPAGTPSLDHVHGFDMPYSPSPAPSRASAMDIDLSDLLGEPAPAASPAVPAPRQPAAPDPWDQPSPSHSSANETLLVGGSGSAGSPGIGGNAALRAYLKGLGLDTIDCTPEQAAEYLELAGGITRQAVAGIMQLLLSRSEMKKELRAADRTMLSARANNPLKMMESEAEALRFLFGPDAGKNAAFMPPLEAINDACSDILAHEFGLVAGLRAAVIGAIKQCDPATMEKLAEKQGKLGGLLANRKAQLWDTFLEWYEKTEETCADDVDRLFERDFLRAYMQQVEKMKKS